MKSLIIVSNNVLSTTKSNGKTLYSFVDGVKDLKICQLYFSNELPEIEGISYFRISDRDVIKGRFCKNRRGRVIDVSQQQKDFSSGQKKNKEFKNIFGKTVFTQMIRDVLWMKSWKSKQLINWVKENKPDAMLFCAGDSIFAYKIVKKIVKQFRLRLTVYITDDYVLPRCSDSIIARFRRNRIKKNLKNLLSRSSSFYTISPSMQKAYLKSFGVKSNLALNIPKDNDNKTVVKKEKRTVLVYTGSLYYGRDILLSEIGKAIKEWNRNKSEEEKAILKIYSNIEPSKNVKQIVSIEDGSRYVGSLNAKQLRERLQTADVLVFVESFDPIYLEKTKYSLSTKVPEYLRQGKAILAVGPKENGSMQMLKSAAFCISEKNSLYKNVRGFLDSSDIWNDLSSKAETYYKDNFDSVKFQKLFIRNVMGEN